MEEETWSTGAALGDRGEEAEEEQQQQPRRITPVTMGGPEEASEGCEGLWELPVEFSARRPECGRCGRPQKVCLCPFLPIHPLKVSTCLYIIQHPAEESRVLRTVPLLAACLPEDKCKVLIGRRFSEDRYPDLASVCRNSKTLILYPGAGAANLEEEDLSSSDPYAIIIIDGTWSQAKDIFFKNSLFRIPKQVQLRTSLSSQYVIRTQPTNACLSTLECAAIALAIMEKNDGIKETVLRPLQALCSFQLQHGAQVHHSKEHLLKNGLYDKPMPKNKRKLRRMELLVNNVKI
ncbi:tRNA-uridine aminocarboxypropyltransferase 2 [Elgaria multicarinata webbii]|uniref:tRNA-uridine aminocarboxypropyltransferase 2 n=1 Tax=Elgaria multicarinata webbii TaxID=159646 RepID=UPI002FCD2A64